MLQILYLNNLQTISGHVLGGRISKSNGRDELDQSTLYVGMEIPQ
jgi:hypothetical protein